MLAVITFIYGSVVYSLPVNAEEYCNTLKYTATDNKIIITGYSGNPEVLNIPSRIEGKEVCR
jgi:hypothetical protein